jgi:hypothetical protein
VCLVSVVAQTRYLAQPQFAAEQPHALIGQPVGHLTAVNDSGAVAEPSGRNTAGPAFAVGEDVEPLRNNIPEQLWAPAAAVKDHGYAALAYKAAQFSQQRRQHMRQTGVRLGGNHE